MLEVSQSFHISRVAVVRLAATPPYDTAHERIGGMVSRNGHVKGKSTTTNRHWLLSSWHFWKVHAYVNGGTASNCRLSSKISEGIIFGEACNGDVGTPTLLLAISNCACTNALLLYVHLDGQWYLSPYCTARRDQEGTK